MPTGQIPLFVKNFYDDVAVEFSTSRNHPWLGWEKMWEFISSTPLSRQDKIRILDLGCGNGRLAKFYTRKLVEIGANIEYLGIDISPKLLKLAAESHPDYSFELADLTKSENLVAVLGSKQFDIINLIAVLHHFPDQNSRLSLIRSLRDHLSANGIVVFTAWDFPSEPSLERLILRDEERKNYLSAHNLELGKGDYVLSWGKKSGGSHHLRFAHHLNSSDTDEIVSASGLFLADSFAADGRSGKLNKYFLMTNKTQLTDKDTAKVADLIKLKIPAAELHAYTSQLNTALDSVDILRELDTEKTAITSQTHGLKNILRKDEPLPGLDIDDYSNRKNLKNRYFVVKKVIN